MRAQRQQRGETQVRRTGGFVLRQLGYRRAHESPHRAVFVKFEIGQPYACLQIHIGQGQKVIRMRQRQAIGVACVPPDNGTDEDDFALIEFLSKG